VTPLWEDGLWLEHEGKNMIQAGLMWHEPDLPQKVISHEAILALD